MTATTEAAVHSKVRIGRYSSGMVKRRLMGVGDFRLRYRKRFEAAELRQEHTLISNRGKPSVAVVPMDWYERASKALGEMDGEDQLAVMWADDSEDE